MVAVAGALLVASGTAGAATKTTNIGVSAVVNPNCLISAPDLAFGDYDGTADLFGTSVISVRCTTGAGYTLSLSAGGGAFSQRLMSDGGSNELQYNLFTTAARATVWGDGSGSTGTVGGIGAGMGVPNARTHTVYGELLNSAVNQIAPSGSYNDLITVTITY
jgi:spore coat protein U-like protein